MQVPILILMEAKQYLCGDDSVGTNIEIVLWPFIIPIYFMKKGFDQRSKNLALLRVKSISNWGGTPALSERALMFRMYRFNSLVYLRCCSSSRLISWLSLLCFIL